MIQQHKIARGKTHAQLIVCVLAGLATIYSTPPAVAMEIGTRLRVTERDATSRAVVGTFGGLRGDTLILVDQRTNEPLPIAFSAIEALERSRGLRGHSLAGAGIGLCTGAIAGGLLGAASQPHDASILFTGNHVAAVGAIVMGLGGAVVGALVGTAWRSESWRPVPMKELQVQVRLSAPGAPEIRLAMRF